MPTLTISPVTRVEGHGRITVQVDEGGQLEEVLFQVASFRGFEEFLRGVAVERLPALTSRVCGICPVAHQLASVKAIESALGVTVPATAGKLRELLLLGQYLSSHILSLGVLSLPDLLMPGESVEKRNLVGLMRARPTLVQQVMQLREVGMAFFNIIGRREVHIGACVVGGMSKPLAEEERQELLGKLQAAEPALRQVMEVVRSLLGQGADIELLGNLPSPAMGLTQDGALTLCDGMLSVMDEGGKELARFAAADYFEHIEERVQDWSYMKFPVLKDGRWLRVGPLARLNVNEHISTAWAQGELETYRRTWGRPVHATVLYHYARAIETVYSWERAVELLQDPDITSPDVWTAVEPRAGTGVGVIEAPRGTLVHSYVLDGEGYATDIKLVVATQHNNDAINATLRAIAPRAVGAGDSEPALNQMEMVVRAYDPCLSCATHTLNRGRALPIQVVGRTGRVLQEW
jgi:F420-non-reducing hydrogenase large subunit